MSRSVHQANHSRYSHLRRIPAWHHQNSFKFYTPSTSARMEKKMNEERKGQWHWSGFYEESGPIAPSFAETCFCPCNVYSRSWARLKAAFAGEDAQRDPNLDTLNIDCCEMLVCFPVYSIFIYRLQASVRSFYGIKGDEAADCLDACFCPCQTLQRNEYEIMIREKHHRRCKFPCDNSAQISSYLSHGSMVYSASHTGTPSTSNQHQEKSGEEPKSAVPAIIIDTAVDSMPRHPIEGNIPIINITSPQVVIETKSPSYSVVCVADPQVASGVIIQPEHGLEDDPTTVVVRGKFKEHLLNQDAATDTALPPKAKEHRIKEDISQKQPKPSAEHSIVECIDGTASPPLGSAQAKSTLLSVKEASEHRSIEIESFATDKKAAKPPSATTSSHLPAAVRHDKTPRRAVR